MYLAIKWRVRIRFLIMENTTRASQTMMCTLFYSKNSEKNGFKNQNILITVLESKTITGNRYCIAGKFRNHWRNNSRQFPIIFLGVAVCVIFKAFLFNSIFMFIGISNTARRCPEELMRFAVNMADRFIDDCRFIVFNRSEISVQKRDDVKKQDKVKSGILGWDKVQAALPFFLFPYKFIESKKHVG